MCYVVDLRCPGHHHYSPRALRGTESWGVQGVCSARGNGTWECRRERSRRVAFIFLQLHERDVEHLRATSFWRDLLNAWTERFGWHKQTQCGSTEDVLQTRAHTLTCTRVYTLSYKHTHTHAHTPHCKACQPGMIDEARIQCTVWSPVNTSHTGSI